MSLRHTERNFRSATLVGFSAILMWSFLTLLTVASGRTPPFQLAALTFAIGGLVGVASFAVRGIGITALCQPPEVWALAAEYAPGYAAAFVAAFVWSTYSVLSRRFAAVPSDAVAGFCLATAVLAALCHML